MTGWSRVDGIAVALPMESVDTDQLIPARFMSTPRSDGYGRHLLHDLRAGDPGFPLDAEGASGAVILVCRRNFGSGSSREAAVYALVDAGFRAVVAPSFGDIFAANSANNGLVPACVDAEAVERMIAALARPAPGAIDVEAGRVSVAGVEAPFELDPVWRTKILNGWDDIDLTADWRAEIGRFRSVRREEAPWAWPSES